MAKKNFRLAIDGNEANVPNRVGSNVYAYEIIKALYQITQNNKNYQITVLLSSDPLADLPAARANWHYQKITPAKFWTQFGLPIHLFLQKNKYDVFYTPGHYGPRISSVPFVSSVMDLAFLHFKDQFKKSDLWQLTRWTKYSVKNAAQVIAISEYTKQDIIAQYHKKPEAIKVVYPAVDSSTHLSLPKTVKAVRRRFKLKYPYLLYVGTIQPRKNLINLIEAFEDLSRRLIAKPKKSLVKQPMSLLQLVIAGKIGWLADDILARIEASPFKKQIVLTGFVDEATKQILYENAEASVLIGTYEGFGIPALEAFKFGCVVVVANNTSLPEVVGEAGILVDPYSIESIAQGLLTAFTLKAAVKAKLKKLGREQLKKFSYFTSAQQVLEILTDLAKKHDH